MKNVLFGFILLCGNVLSAQSFSIDLDTLYVGGVPEVHSGAYAQLEGKTILIGGRDNGLHGFLPPFAFPNNGINKNVWVVDLYANQSWSALTTALPDSIYEPISSSNMQFYQEDSTLYMVGGYGWHASINNFITHPTLTAVDLKGLMNAVITAQPIDSYFRQIRDTVFAVCGTHLFKLDSTYHLPFGHRFDGYYDRSDTSGFFQQDYSYQIRSFQIQDDGVNLSISNYQTQTDTANFRRRDLNIVPQIFPDGSEGLTAFTGVFRPDDDLPFLNTIDIQTGSYQLVPNFNQYLSQYHSAVMPLFDSAANEMHTVFLGGISMYELDSLNNLVLDSLVPFVNTISGVTRRSDSSMSEYAFNERMPSLLGTNTYFLLDTAVPMLSSHIIDCAALNGRTRVGFLLGGIETPEKNISLTDPSQSYASQVLYEVYIDKSMIASTKPVTPLAIDFSVYPNPTLDIVSLRLAVNQALPVEVRAFNAQGQLIRIWNRGQVGPSGELIKWDMTGKPAGLYLFRLKVGNHVVGVKVVKD